MLKKLKYFFYLLILITFLFFAGMLVHVNAQEIMLELFFTQMQTTTGTLLIGALVTGLLLGFLLDELVNFLSSRINKRKVRKLEAKVQQLKQEQHARIEQ